MEYSWYRIESIQTRHPRGENLYNDSELELWELRLEPSWLNVFPQAERRLFIWGIHALRCAQPRSSIRSMISDGSILPDFRVPFVASTHAGICILSRASVGYLSATTYPAVGCRNVSLPVWWSQAAVRDFILPLSSFTLKRCEEGLRRD